MEGEAKKQSNKNKKNTKTDKKRKPSLTNEKKVVKAPLKNRTIPDSKSTAQTPIPLPVLKEKKVLMLGWEFPPVINGGLGVACLGLSKGLSKFVDLTVILPKSDPTFIVENVDLIGLNNIDLRQILKQGNLKSESGKAFVAEQINAEEKNAEGSVEDVSFTNNLKEGDKNPSETTTTTTTTTTEYETFAKTEYVNIQIDPYYHTTKAITDETTYLKNLTTRINMGEGEEEITDKGNPVEPVAASREFKSVFAYATSPEKEQYVEENDALQTDNLMIEDFLHAFRDGELYGEDVIQKVILYSKYVLKLASKKEFDIIYAHDWMTFLAGIEVKEKTGKPLALHVHALDYDRGGPDSKGWIFELEKFAMENADLIMPVSNYTASVITGHYGIDPKKVFAVHNGADHVDVFKEEKGFPEKLVLFLGRVTGQKGPEFFLEVASKVFESYPKVRFVVAGTGDKLKRLIETGAYREIGHKFHFTGFLNKEKVHRLLAMTDVYCMPSVSEPFGLSALEAAQFGVPMVISKQSGVAEVLGGALSADYWDVNLMADHIISLLKSKRLTSKVVNQSAEDLKHLTWDIAAEKIYNNFLHVLK